jgi:CBS domain-containing protein
MSDGEQAARVDGSGNEGGPEVGAESVEEVVPEAVEAGAAMRVVSHHPPPPPRVRSTAAAARPIQVGGDPKLARDLMTRQLFTVGPDDPIGKLEAHMVNLHFRHLPVVSGEKAEGLISHADLLQAASSVLSTTAAAENAVIGKLPASRIMQRDLVTARPDETLAAVAERLWSTRAEAILVTEEDGTLVGILTERDFVRLAHHLLARG